ncbi:MAG TPA: acyl transferase, partial [Phnomibacter sp.]|nr:acyl transferase [Phnomibacter sp.]
SLSDAARLAEVLTRREHQGQKSILLGVTFALLDFAEAFPMALQHTTVMETGGMKGRKREITRAEVHELLKARLGVDAIHSEYGMTELLSQAYAKGEGRYYTPPWMRALVRAEDDPGAISTAGTGQLCIVDLANWDSCCFIETADVGRVYADGSFEVLGRLDYSDVRGCSLLAV